MQPPRRRNQMIDRLTAGHYDDNETRQAMTPREANYAIWLGFRVYAKWTPYEGRDVTHRIAAAENLAAFDPNHGGPTVQITTIDGKKLTLNADQCRVYAPQPTTAEITTALAKPSKHFSPTLQIIGATAFKDAPTTGQQMESELRRFQNQR